MGEPEEVNDKCQDKLDDDSDDVKVAFNTEEVVDGNETEKEKEEEEEEEIDAEGDEKKDRKDEDAQIGEKSAVDDVDEDSSDFKGPTVKLKRKKSLRDANITVTKGTHG